MTTTAPFIRKQTSIKSEVPRADTGEHEEEESGLVFVNPDDERRIKLEKEKQLKKKEVPMFKMKDGTQAMMLPGLTGSSNSAAASQA